MLIYHLFIKLTFHFFLSLFKRWFCFYLLSFIVGVAIGKAKFIYIKNAIGFLDYFFKKKHINF